MKVSGHPALGLGTIYNEELLADIATATHGSFYDVKTEDNLPGIFAKELEGLQQISIQNLRIAVKAGKAPVIGIRLMISPR